MKIVVGLGNPGPKYETTRHNIGFLCVDYLVDEWKAQGPEIKNQCEVWKCKVGDEQVLLLKPQTFMNLSGRGVAPFYQFYKCKPEDLIVVYDEVDLTPLEIRFKEGGGSGGHNGIKSIDECLGAGQLNYVRGRLGVGHPRTINPNIDVADWVLGKIPDAELNELVPMFGKVQKAIELIFQGKLKEAMNKYHGKPKPKDPA
ncbi:MAG: aminoacyl-tRNA hydrolase [Bdellovibrionales bacterium]|nr:aminoacyl-tRNA hydrolase [Bdellovibrionales bacterium]